MKLKGFLSVFLYSILLITGCEEKEKNSKPNFILIIADVSVWNDSGAYGNFLIQTPNINRLASEGICFDNGFLTIRK